MINKCYSLQLLINRQCSERHSQWSTYIPYSEVMYLKCFIYNTIQYSTVQYNTTQYSTVRYGMVYWLHSNWVSITSYFSLPHGHAYMYCRWKQWYNMALTRKEYKDSSATHWTSFSVRKITERVLKIICSVSFVHTDTFLKFRAIWQFAVKVNFQVVINLKIATLTPKKKNKRVLWFVGTITCSWIWGFSC